MIRLFLLAFLSLFAPFAAWYVWQVFGKKPTIDPQTGDQVPPDFEKAPRGKLWAIGAVLSVLTVGGFLLFQQLYTEAPYKPIDVNKFEKPSMHGTGEP